MSTRRDVMLHGAIGVGVIASAMSGVSALAQVAPPTRRSLAGLAWNDPIVATYRDAVGIMKQAPATDKFSWISLAQIHGTDPNHYHFCPHGDWYFLPWHRAYTAMYERVVRKLTGNKSFAMPYWDWTANPLMPEVFLSPKTPDGKTNWLFNSDQGFQRTWPPKTPMPDEIVGPAVLKRILNAPTYEAFGTTRNPNQNNLDMKWVVAGGGRQGTLEATPHNMVHNNVGGWMPSASSPRDPLFFMHHSNIDRIWALWNLNHANSKDPLWTGMVFKDNLLNVDGTSWSPQVSQLYVPEALGYTYGLPKPKLLASAVLAGLDNKFSTLFALAPGATAAPAGVQTAVVANTKAAAAGSPLEVAVTVPPAALSAVRSRTPVGSGLDIMAFASAQEQAAKGTRALAFLRDVEISDPTGTMFRVFVDADNVSEATPITDPHYVGTFGVFHAGGHDDHKALPSFALDLTEALERTDGGASGQIRVQVVAVPARAGEAAGGKARPAAVEVSFIAN